MAARNGFTGARPVAHQPGPRRHPGRSIRHCRRRVSMASSWTMNVIADPATQPSTPVLRAGAMTRRSVERALLREVLMGAQDNLTNVLAVVLGVAVGAGRADMVALAGLAAGIAEAISMGG